MSINKVGDDWDTVRNQAQGNSPTNIQGNKYDSICYGDCDPKQLYSHQASKIFTNDKAINKIIKRYERVPHDFNVYLVASKKLANEPIGLPSASTHRYEYDSDKDEFILSPIGYREIYTRLGITPEQAPIIQGKINLFITEWGVDPPTAWMIAHRFAHTIGVPDMNYYHEMVNNLSRKFKYDSEEVERKLSTIRSVIEGKTDANSMENGHEMIAQYIMKGKVSFNKQGEFAPYANEIQKVEDYLNRDIGAKMSTASHAGAYIW